MKKQMILIFSLMMLVLLSACGEEASKESKESQASTKDSELKEIDLMLDWYPNAVHSFIYVAEENGYFADEGLKVNIQFPANTTDPLNLAAAGKITLGLYYQPDVITARANENIRVKSTGTIVRSPLNHLIFLNETPIKSPKDLVGKKVGYPGIAINEALMKTMVAHDGGNPKQVDLIDVGFELGSAVISGQVDAVYGAFVNHEVPVLEHQGHNIAFLNPAEYGVPEYSELIAVTSDDTWEERKADIEAFWRAAEKGFAFMEENPDEALQILLDHQDEANFPLNKEVEQKSMEILLPKMTSDEGFGSQTKESWQETAEWLKEVEIIKEIPDVEQFITE